MEENMSSENPAVHALADPLHDSQESSFARSFDKLRINRLAKLDIFQPRLLLVGFLLLLGASVGFFLGKYFSSTEVRPKFPPISGKPLPPTARIPDPAPTDETVNWQTYTSSQYGFSIKYPEVWYSLDQESAGQLVLFLDKTYLSKSIPPTHGVSGGLQVNVYKPGVYSEYNPPDKIEKTSISLAGMDAVKIVDKEPERSDLLFRTRVILSKGNTYEFIYTNANENEDHNPVFDQILSTFKFLDQTSSVNPIKTITIPSDWKSFTATDQEFKVSTTMSLPPGLSFRFTGSEFTIQNDSDATEIWEYFTSVLDSTTNSYKGESRRDWYQNYLEGNVIKFSDLPEFKTKGTIISVLEHPIGVTSYLEVTDKPNYGKSEKHYLYVQNGILNIVKPSSEKANSDQAVLPQNMGTILYSLSVKRTN